ncbi:cupin domain-containing protein [Vulcaniibacterium gelatinicum]|uniref:cupin domain-containing protein n=1 Tax=Vulcaniibacterium gelatinicum TaxID=2598725 RepID=UPI0011CCB330|nr:cupin domain-containing protein [Vulcaniibacterium gelatinicum]
MNAIVARLLAAGGLLPLALPALAQDPAVVAPDIYECKFENAQVRLCEVTFEPGEKIASHSHPPHLVYVLEPGKLRITPAGGQPGDAEFTVGQTVWMPAETHSAENIGGTRVKALVIELREAKP